MIFHRATLVCLLASILSAQGQELRANAAVVAEQQRSLQFGTNILCRLFGNCPDDDQDREEEPEQEERPGIWCGLFGNCPEDNDGGNSNNPIGDALNKTRDSEQPLRTFLGELLNQPSSDSPVRDFIQEALNRTDTPLLDFLAELFDSSRTKPIQDFVRDLVNGSSTPLRDSISDWLDDEVFGDLNCTLPAEAPPCAYNLDGDEGVWVCRTLNNPFKSGRSTNKTVCAHPSWTLAENDKCGSCDGTYPTPCPCACDVNGNAGVYLKLTGEDDQQCVSSKWAVTALNRWDSVECFTEC